MSEQPKANEPTVELQPPMPSGVQAVQPLVVANNRFVNSVVSALAIFVSLVSLWLAFSANRTQERLLAASSWPHLTFGHGNFDSERQRPSISLELKNGGNGPALLRWAVVRLDGRPMGDPRALFDACCTIKKDGQRIKTSNISSPATNTILTAGETRNIMGFDKVDESIEVWEALDKARWSLEFEACYCSLVGDCWVYHSTDDQRIDVDTCAKAPAEAWRSGKPTEQASPDSGR
jgi:hypothetical protein